MAASWEGEHLFHEGTGHIFLVYRQEHTALIDGDGSTAGANFLRIITAVGFN
jgi:hypothetical protein